MRTALIDADVLIYWTAFGCQKTRYKTAVQTFDDNKSYEAYLKELPIYQAALKETGKKREAMKRAKEQLPAEKVLDLLDVGLVPVLAKGRIKEVVEAVSADEYVLFVSGSENFRESIATLKPYKGNRVQEKPVYFDTTREFFLNHHACVLSEGQEADDDIGIRQTQMDGKGIICTIDKDLMQIPGYHYNWNKDAKFKVTPDKADLWFWMQMLIGDTADNIPGIDQIGPAGAADLLSDTTSRIDRSSIVAEHYREQYGSEWKNAINEVGKLLWIRRQPDELWDYDAYLNGEDLCKN